MGGKFRQQGPGNWRTDMLRRYDRSSPAPQPPDVMTEQRWWSCEDPSRVLRLARLPAGDPAYRLFACAAARHTWDRFTDPRCRAAVERAELYAVGLLSAAELEATWTELKAASAATREALDLAQSQEREARQALLAVVNASASRVAAGEAAVRAAREAGGVAERVLPALDFACLCAGAVVGPEIVNQACSRFGSGWAACNALREILGNPFRPVAFGPSWASPDALSLARLLHTTRQFDDLPILADALEEAGCANEDVLRHCRQPGAHVGGCWVVAGVLRGGAAGNP